MHYQEIWIIATSESVNQIVRSYRTVGNDLTKDRNAWKSFIRNRLTSIVALALGFIHRTARRQKTVRGHVWTWLITHRENCFTQFELLRCLCKQKIMTIQISYSWDICRFVTWDTLGMAGIWPHLTKSGAYYLECCRSMYIPKTIYFCTPLNSMQQENTKI